MQRELSVPRSHEAEMAVVGGLLLDPEKFAIVQEIIHEADFYQEAHRRLYRSMRALWDTSGFIDPVTLTAALQASDDFQQVGGAGYLAELFDAVPSAENIAYHARVVAEKAQRRRLIAAAAQVQQAACSDMSIDDLLDSAEREVFKAAERREMRGVSDLRSAMWEAMKVIEHGVKGLGTGYHDLDDMTCGLQGGQLVLLAGRPAMGKSALGLNIACNVAIEQNKPVLMFSYEMSDVEISMRVISSYARVDLQPVRKRGQSALTEDAIVRINQTVAGTNRSPITFDFHSQSVAQVRSRARRLKAEKGLSLIVVDYLQQMDGVGDTREQQVASVSRGLKKLAMELDVPVLGVCQLSRESEKRESKRPLMSDLRESGSLEQDADSVWFVHRPEYYDGPTDKEGNNLVGLAEVIVAKQRSGPVGTVPLTFFKEFTLFENRSNREHLRGHAA